jgi:hypothetical protein
MMLKILTATFALGLAATAYAQSEGGEREASQFVPVANEPPAELFVDPPLAAPLARGAVVIPYRTKHFRILPIFGTSALDVTPRAGHLHVSVDDLPWRWADAGGNGSVVVNGLPAGPHRILIELALPDHKVIAAQAVTFIVPASPAGASHHP